MFSSTGFRKIVIAVLLAVSSIGVAFADNKVVVVPLGGGVDEATIQSLEDRVTALEAQQPFIVSVRRFSQSIQSASETVLTLNLTAPTDGSVLVEFVAAAEDAVATEGVRCSISTSQVSNLSHRWRTQSTGNIWSQLAGQRVLPVSAGSSAIYYLVCDTEGAASASVIIYNIAMSATFYPTP